MSHFRKEIVTESGSARLPCALRGALDQAGRRASRILDDLRHVHSGTVKRPYVGHQKDVIGPLQAATPRATHTASRRALLEGYGATGREKSSQTLDLYHLYFVIELWCWMAQIGNRQPLDKLALDLERYSTM